MEFSSGSLANVVATIDLALHIATALSTRTGPSHECRNLIQELNSLTYVLRLTDAATHIGMLRSDVLNAVVAEIADCHVVMESLRERIHRGHQRELGYSRKVGVVGTSWRRLRWGLVRANTLRRQGRSSRSAV